MTSGVEADGHWLAGLTDGEGTFYLDARRRRDGKHSHVNWSFKIALREDDTETLVRAQEILGGIGWTSGYKPKDGHRLSQFGVSKRADTRTVVDFFRYYRLRSKKRRDFELWAEAFDLYEARRKATPKKRKRAQQPEMVVHGSGMPIGAVPVQEFKSTPGDLFGLMQDYAERIRKGRQFREPEERR